MKPNFSLRHLMAIVASSLTSISLAPAQTTVNWDGDTSNLWATAGNWDTSPTSSLTANIANFDGGWINAPTIGAGTSIAGITIGGSNGTMTLTTGGFLTIGGSGISIANGAGAFTISGTTILGAAQSWTNNSSNLFTFGAVTNGANTLTIGGTGNTIASGVISNGAGGLTKEGTGILTLNAANLYTGATTVNGGELRWGIANAIAGGALNINNGGTVNMQTFADTVGTITIAKGGSITGTTGILTTGSGGLVSNDGGTISGFSAGAGLRLGGGITYNSSGPGSTTLQIDHIFIPDQSVTVFDIANGDAAIDFEITGTLSGGGNNIGRTLRKTGTGVMQLSGSTANTTSTNQMPLEIWDGTVIFNKSAEVNAIPNSAITIGDGIGAAGSAILQYRTSNNQIQDSPITINSDGLFDLNGFNETTAGALTVNGGSITTGVGTLTLGNATNTISGASTVTGNLTFSGTAATNLTLGGTASINGTTTFSGGNGGGITATGTTSIAGTLAFGSNSRTIAVNTGSDTLTITANITGSGALTKNGAGTLQIGDGTTAGSMSSTSALSMGGGTLAILAPTTGGSSQTIASLATTASTGSTIRITPGSSGNTTLTITSGTASTGAGSSLNFDYTAGTTVGSTVGNNSVVWNTTLTGGIIGGAYTVTDSGGTGFATKNGSNVVIRLTDPGGAGLPTGTGSATGSYFIGSSYSTDTTTTPGSLVQALSGAVNASNVTVNTTGLASGANLALGTNLLTLGAGMVFDGPNAYEISGSGAGGLRAATSGGTINLYNANTSTVTISAPIVANGTSRLTVDGPGTTILSGVNTYTGATVLNGGITRFSGTMAASPITLNNGAVAQVGTASGLTSSNTITFGAGATGSLQLLGNNLTIGALNSNTTTLGTPVITNNNGGDVLANATLTINSASNSTFGGVIQDGAGGGTLALINSGGGTLTLSGINTYSGGTTLTGGLLLIGADAHLGDAAGSITFNGGGMRVSNIFSSDRQMILNNVSGNLLQIQGNGQWTNTGAITGDGGLIVRANPNGGTTANLYSQSNIFKGALGVENSTGGAITVRLRSLTDSSTATGNIIFGAAHATNGQTFEWDSSAGSALTLNNRKFEFGGNGNAVATINNAHASNAITINTDLIVSGTGTKTLTLSAVVGPTNVFSGNISNGTGGGTVGLTKSGAGTWVIGNSANTYTGTTTIGGTLIIDTLSNYGSASSLGAATTGDIIFDKNLTSTLIYVGDGDTTNRTIRHEADVSNRNNGSGLYNNGTAALIFNGITFNTPFVASGNGGRTTTFNLGGTYAGSANEIRGVIANNDASSLIAITKNGSGTWTLAGSNSYTGATTLNAGTLRLNYDTGANGTNTSKLANTNGILALNGGTLELVGGSHTEVVTSTTLNNGTSFVKRPSGSSTLSMGVITYTGGALDFSAAGIANVSTSAVTNGILSSAAGTARVTVGGADWAAKDGSNNVIAYTGYTNFDGTASAANINYSTVGNATLTGNRGATSNTFKITTSGTGQSMKLNSNFNLTLGSLLFAGADDYTIAAESGTGRINSAFLLHNYGAGTLTLGATNGAITQYGTGKTILTGNNAANVGINIFGGTVQFSNNLQIGTNTGVQAIALNNGTLLADTTSADIALNNGGLNSRTVTLGAGGGTLDVIGGGKLTVSGVISDTAGQFPTLTIGSASSDGTVELTGTNTYTGRTSISGGILSVAAIGNGGVAGNLGQASNLAYNIVFDGGTLLYTGDDATSDRAFTINAGKTATINTTNNLSLVGATGAATTGALTKTGAGILTLTGSSTYTGTTTISAGTLALGHATNTLANTSAVNVNGGTLSLGANSDTVGAVTLTSGSITSSTGVLTGSSYDVRSGSVSAILGGSGALTKSTSGTVTLTGANTYTGLTTVTAGTLRVHGSTAAASNFIVENGGTLGGSGTIGGNVTLNSGATLAPGASIESLATGSNTWNGGSRVQFEFSTDGSTGTAGAQWDLLTITGTLDLTGASSGNPITFDLVSMLDATTSGPLASWDPDANTTWSGIVTTTGGITGFASNLFAFNTTGFTNTLNGTFNISQNGNNLDLNYVTNYVIPEPKAALLGAIGILLLLRRRR